MHRGMTMWGHREKAAIYKPRREVSEETNPADTLILDIQPPELGEIYFCGLNCPVFVVAAQVG